MSPSTEDTEAGESKFKAGLGCTAENLLTPTQVKYLNQSINRQRSRLAEENRREFASFMLCFSR